MIYERNIREKKGSISEMLQQCIEREAQRQRLDGENAMTDRKQTRQRLIHAFDHAILLAERLKQDDDLPQRSSLTVDHIRRQSIAMREVARALEV